MSRHTKVHHLARMIQDNKHVEDLKANRGNGEQVHSPRHMQVMTQEAQRILALLPSSFRLEHVLTNRLWAKTTGLFLLPHAFFVEAQLTSDGNPVKIQVRLGFEKKLRQRLSHNGCPAPESRAFEYMLREGFEHFHALNQPEEGELHNFSNSLEVKAYEVSRVDSHRFSPAPSSML